MIGTNSVVAVITVIKAKITGTEVRLTTSNGLTFPIPAVATTTPETGDMVLPKLEACSIGMIKNAGFNPILAANAGASSTNA